MDRYIIMYFCYESASSKHWSRLTSVICDAAEMCWCDAVQRDSFFIMVYFNPYLVTRLYVFLNRGSTRVAVLLQSG